MTCPHCGQSIDTAKGGGLRKHQRDAPTIDNGSRKVPCEGSGYKPGRTG